MLDTRVWRPDRTFKAITGAIFPQSTDNELPNLVHISNGFHMFNNASPLHIDGVITIGMNIALSMRESRLSILYLHPYTTVALRITKTPLR